MIDRILISISINKNSFIVENFISISAMKIDVKYERPIHKELKEVIFYIWFYNSNIAFPLKL